MKTTLIIQDNINQIVLTPENDYEKNILNLIDSNKVDTTLKVGNFTECRGGWIRYFQYHPNRYDEGDIDSLMLILKQKSQ